MMKIPGNLQATYAMHERPSTNFIKCTLKHRDLLLVIYRKPKHYNCENTVIERGG